MYRDPALALELRLAHLREARAALDADIESTQILLDAWRPPAPRRRWPWWVSLTVSVTGMIVLGFGFVVLDPLCMFSFCCPAREDTTRTRAATIRSAATLDVAQTPGPDCPTIQDLFDDGYLQEGSEPTDGWGDPYWIHCDRGEVSVRSPHFDGENILEPPE